MLCLPPGAPLEAGRAEPVVQAHPGSGRRHRLHLEG